MNEVPCAIPPADLSPYITMAKTKLIYIRDWSAGMEVPKQLRDWSVHLNLWFNFINFTISLGTATPMASDLEVYLKKRYCTVKFYFAEEIWERNHWIGH